VPTLPLEGRVKKALIPIVSFVKQPTVIARSVSDEAIQDQSR
jgi:hypothetical protein